MKKNIPNIITLMNLFFGFTAIIYAFNGVILHSFLCIVISMILDAMDGRIARKLNVQGEFGKELDSLADIVTFGVAPAIMLYATSLIHLGLFGIILASVFPLCGALRLARFNTDGYKVSDHFVGLPITLAGGILALLITVEYLFSSIILVSITFILSILMISEIKFPSFKRKN